MHAPIIEANVKPAQVKNFLKTTAERRHLLLLRQQPGCS